MAPTIIKDQHNTMILLQQTTEVARSRGTGTTDGEADLAPVRFALLCDLLEERHLFMGVDPEVSNGRVWVKMRWTKRELDVPSQLQTISSSHQRLPSRQQPGVHRPWVS